MKNRSYEVRHISRTIFPPNLYIVDIPFGGHPIAAEQAKGAAVILSVVRHTTQEARISVVVAGLGDPGTATVKTVITMNASGNPAGVSRSSTSAPPNSQKRHPAQAAPAAGSWGLSTSGPQ
jgi:hypothetical protein